MNIPPDQNQETGKALRLAQMKLRDIPWHLRAASTLGKNAWNLNGEISHAFQKGIIPDDEHHRIKRRCETDAIEFGGYISIRWLLELCGIKFQPAPKGTHAVNGQKLKLSDNDNYMLSDYNPEFAVNDKKLQGQEARVRLQNHKAGRN